MQSREPGPVPWRTLVLTWCVVTILVVATWLALGPLYNTNDDVAFRLAIAGLDIPGERPTGLLLTSHAMLTSAAAAVQPWSSDLPVWDIVLASSFLAGLATSVASVSSGFASRLPALAAVLALLTTVIPYVNSFQFTISAILMGGAATLLTVREVLWSGRPRLGVLACAAVLLAGGVMVRPMGGQAGAAVTAVLCVPLLLARIRQPAVAVTTIKVLAATAVLVVVLAVTDRLFYGFTGEWADYYRHHWRIAALIDWGGAGGEAPLAAVREAAGWSENDWTLLRARWGAHPTLYGFETIAGAADAVTRFNAERGPAAGLATQLARLDVSSLQRLASEQWPVMLIAAAVAACLGAPAAVLLTLLEMLLFLVLSLAIEAQYKELPFRVLAPLTTCLLGAVIVVTAAYPRRSRSGPLLLVAIALALLVPQTRTLAREAAADHEHARGIERQVLEVLQKKPSLLVLHADSFPHEHWWRPFHTPPAAIRGVHLGWNNMSPRLQRFLSSTDRADLLRAMCVDPSILVVTEQEELEAVTRYWQEHLGHTVVWTSAFDGSFRVWRCEEKGPPPDAVTR